MRLEALCNCEEIGMMWKASKNVDAFGMLARAELMLMSALCNFEGIGIAGMRRRTSLFLGCFALCVAWRVSGCDDGDNGWNGGAFDDARVAYIADNIDETQISGAWVPSAVVAIDSERWMYADRGTRQIVEVNRGSKRIIWDLSDYELLLGDEPWGNDWGYSLTSIGNHQYVLAAPGRPIIALDRTTGAVEVIGKRTNQRDEHSPVAMDEMSIEAADFGQFRGIGRGTKNVYWVFGNAIYEMTMAPNAEGTGNESQNAPFDSLKSAKLIRIVGNLAADAAGESGNARDVGRSFAQFTHVVEDEGILYAWETFEGAYLPARLLAIDKSNDKVVVVTGNGVRTPPSNLEDFYAYHLPASPTIIARQGKVYSPYWKDASHVLVVDIESIDWETLSARGTVDWFVSPLEHTSGIATWGEYDLAFDAKAGSFWRLPRSDWETHAICIDGAKTQDERLGSLYHDGKASPYAYNALVGTTSLYSWLDGAFALAYAPTIERLSLVNMKTKDVELMRIGAIDALATDGKQRAWYKVGNAMNFLSLDKMGAFETSYVPAFFKSPSQTGSPCSSDVFKLTSVPKLAATGSALLMLLPEQGRATIYRSKSLSMNDVFEGGWFVPKSHGESDLYDFYNDGIAVSAMTAHNIHGDLLVSVQKFDDRQYIIATNVFSGPESILGHELAGDKSIVVAGTGDQPIRDGSARADVALNDIAGVDFSPNHDAIWIARSDGSIYRLDGDNIWKYIENSCIKQAADLGIDAISHACNDDICIWGIHTAQGSRLCSEEGELLYTLPTESTNFATCGDGSWIYTTPNAMCIITPNSNNAPNANNTPICSHFSLNGTAYEIIDTPTVSCDRANVYVAARFAPSRRDDQQTNDEAQKSSVFVMQGSKSHDGSIAWTQSFGNGVGLPNSVTIGTAKLGTELGKMDFDKSGAVYMWLRDTCTIWRVPNAKSIERDSVVERILTDDALCNAQAVSFGDNGTIYIAQDGNIYRYNANKSPSNANLIAANATHIPGTVFDMLEIDDALMTISSDGLFVVKKNGVEKRLNHPTYVYYNEKTSIDYAYNAGAMARMARIPHKKAFWLPTFKNATIIEITVNYRYF